MYNFHSSNEIVIIKPHKNPNLPFCKSFLNCVWLKSRMAIKIIIIWKKVAAGNVISPQQWFKLLRVLHTFIVEVLFKFIYLLSKVSNFFVIHQLVGGKMFHSKVKSVLPWVACCNIYDACMFITYHFILNISSVGYWQY